VAKSPSNTAAVPPRRKATVSGGAPKDAVAPQWAQGGDTLTTATGVPVDDTDNSLRVGDRGPTLLDDFHLREKIMHFDHERIPERVVHARGAGAHGTFRLTKSIEKLSCASVLTKPSVETPVFVRFSTVAGSRGSADTARDVRGFAVRFYTQEGNWDLVGNNIPVFFIQDGIKFPDLIHAAKPEPDREIPRPRRPMTHFGTLPPSPPNRPTCSCGPCQTGRFHGPTGRWKGSASIRSGWSTRGAGRHS
jgi:catalase